MPLTPGQVLNNRYRIVSLLKTGGFGAVYRAWDLNLKGPCAVKENFKLEPAEQQQFEREASLLFKLHHPNLPRVFDQFHLPEEGQFLVMDFVEGQDLAEMMQASGGPLPEKTIVSWLIQVCDALTYLHSQKPSVIHRDVKPNNIKITPSGQAVLVDFGIAKTGITGKHTTEAARGVTPGYSPPEQYSRGQTNPRTDIYALGATLYALLTGQEPPPSTDRIAGASLPPPRKLNQSVSPALEKITLKAMAISANQRYQSAAEFKAALVNYHRVPKKPGWLWPVVTAVSILCMVVSVLAVIKVWPQIFPATVTQTAEEGLTFPAGRPSSTVKPIGTESAAQSNLTQSIPTVAKASDTLAHPNPTDTQTATAIPLSSWRQGRLVFIARAGNGTCMYMLDLAAGSEPQILYDPNTDVLLLGPAWSPDVTHIAVAEYGGPLYNFQVETMRLSWMHTGCDVPSWSPDSSQIICHTRGTGTFNILNAVSGAVVESYLLDPGAVHPTWSPSGGELVYSVFNGSRTSIYRASLGTGASQVLLAGDANENYAPAWSPDGQWIAFQSTLGSSLSDLWIMDRNGSSLQRVVYTDSVFWSRAPSYSPDGQWIAFVSNQAGSYGSDYGEIFAINLLSGEVVQVSHTGGLVYDWRVDWGP